jgi:hypothetical protein
MLYIVKSYHHLPLLVIDETGSKKLYGVVTQTANTRGMSIKI